MENRINFGHLHSHKGYSLFDPLYQFSLDAKFTLKEECIENRNLVTNFCPSELAVYEEVVRCYKAAQLFITEEAYAQNGQRLYGSLALRCNEPCKKWEVFQLIGKVETKMHNTMFVVETSDTAADNKPVFVIEGEEQLEWSRKLVNVFNFVNDAEICYIGNWNEDGKDVLGVFFTIGISAELQTLCQSLYNIIVCNNHDEVHALNLVSTSYYRDSMWTSLFKHDKDRDSAFWAFIGDADDWQ